VLNLSAKQIGWLHVPKTGTSFVNVLITWACQNVPDDAAADERYINRTHFTMVADFFAVHHSSCPSELNLCKGHHAVGEECLSMPDHRGHLVGMFRQPEQRVLSGYYARLNETSKGYEPAQYAHLLQGCVVRMLIGFPCAEYSHGETPLESQASLPDGSVGMALARIDTDFAFVGLTEHWALSVCLFHAMFGGQCHRREFHNSRVGELQYRNGERYDESLLDGWSDPFDGPVYDRVQQQFWANVLKFNVSTESCSQNVCRDVPDAFSGSP
jgi:hypothetical protein